jgi:hypothetical protein
VLRIWDVFIPDQGSRIPLIFIPDPESCYIRKVKQISKLLSALFLQAKQARFSNKNRLLIFGTGIQIQVSDLPDPDYYLP